MRAILVVLLVSSFSMSSHALMSGQLIVDSEKVSESLNELFYLFNSNPMAFDVLSKDDETLPLGSEFAKEMFEFNQDVLAFLDSGKTSNDMIAVAVIFKCLENCNPRDSINTWRIFLRKSTSTQDFGHDTYIDITNVKPLSPVGLVNSNLLD